MLWLKSFVEGDVSRYSVIFFALFFCASKKWRLLAQVSRGHQVMTSRSAAQDESSKCFPQFCLVAAFFSPHKMAEKNHQFYYYLDTTALKVEEERELDEG